MIKRLFLVLALLAAPVAAKAQSTGGPSNVPYCNKTATFTGLSAVTSLIASASSKTTFVCGWHVTTSSGTTVTFSITSGTQTTNPCDTGTVTVVPALNITSAAPSSDHIDYAFFNAASGAAVCITPSSSTISGVVYYSQY